MKAVRYPPEFKAKALKQVTERGHGGGVDAARRLGISGTPRRGQWRKRSPAG